MKKLLAIVLILIPCLSQAANKFVRPAATGSATGNDWNNAWSVANLNSNFSTLTGGDTVWMAGGTYTTGIQITKSGTSNTNRILIKRVRSTDSAATSAAGWNSAFDSQVVIDNGLFASIMWPVNDGSTTGSNVTIDGQITDGIKCILGNTTDNNQCCLTLGLWATGGPINNVTISNCDFQAPVGVPSAANNSAVQVMQGSPGSALNVVFNDCKLHGGVQNLKLLFTNGVTFNRCELYDSQDNGSAAQVHPNMIEMNHAVNSTFNNCLFRNWQVVGVEIYGQCDNNIFNGCIFRDMGVGQDVFYIGSFNSNGSGGTLKVLGCTFVEAMASTRIQVPVASDSEARNNLYWNSGTVGTAFASWGLTIVSNEMSNSGVTGTNSVGGIPDPFVNLATRDLHIKSTIAANAPRNKGLNLGAPYNVDFDGNTRGADGAWDIGAYEYTTTVADVIAPAISSATVMPTGNQMTVTFSEGVQFGAGGNAGWSTTLSGVTMTYVSGSGSNAVLFNLSRVVASGETGTISYTQPGNGWQDLATPANLLASASGISVTNNSTQGPPTLTSATINPAGTQLALVFNQTVQAGSGGNGGWTLNVTPSATLGTVTGIGTNTLTYNINRVINVGESVTLNYTQPGNGIESTTSGADVASITSRAVTNNSTQGQTATPVITLPAGPYFGTQSTTITDSDSGAGAVIRYTTDGSTPTATSQLYSGPITISTNQNLKAIAIWSGHANSGVASSAYEVVSWTSAGIAWKTFAVPQQTGTFIWNVSAAAPAAGSDAGVGIGPSPVSGYSGMACIILFNNNVINAINGGSYTAGPAFTPGALYNFVATINITAHTWTLTSTPAAGGTTTTIVTNAAFRSPEQSGATQLSYIGMNANPGTLTVQAMSFPSGAASARYIGLRGVPASGGATP